MSAFKAHQINLYQNDSDAGASDKFQIVAPLAATGDVIMKKMNTFAAVDMQMKFKLSGRTGSSSDFNSVDVGKDLYENSSTAFFEMNFDSKVANRTGNEGNLYDLSADDQTKGEIFNRITADHQLATNMDSFSTLMHDTVTHKADDLPADNQLNAGYTIRDNVADIENFLDEHNTFWATGASGTRESIEKILDEKPLQTMSNESYQFAEDIKTSMLDLGTLLGVDLGTDLMAWSQKTTAINQPSGGTKASIYASANILSSAEYAHLDLSHSVSTNKYNLGAGNSQAVYTSRKNVSTQIEQRREALEQALKADIEDLNATEARLEARIDAVITNSNSTALDSLTELMTVFQNADGSVVNSIATVRSKVDDIVDTLNELLAGLNGDSSTLMKYTNGKTDRTVTPDHESAATSTAAWITQEGNATGTTITGQTTAENTVSSTASTNVHDDVSTADVEQQPGVQL